MTATFTLNSVLSYYHSVPWSLSFPGLISFGTFDEVFINIVDWLAALPRLRPCSQYHIRLSVQDSALSYNGVEIPFFLIMGCVGGLLGALFNYINYKLSIARIRLVAPILVGSCLISALCFLPNL